jgi:uncharacterized OB-fold protein
MSETGAIDRPVPRPTKLSKPFWDATARHELMLQRCTIDGHHEWTPQFACSKCLNESLEWVAVSGLAQVYSYSVVQRPQSPEFEVPYIVAIVELDEGPRMLTSLVDISPGEVHIGMRVRVSFEDAGELALYRFGPAAGSD